MISKFIWGQWRSKEVIWVKFWKWTKRYDFFYIHTHMILPSILFKVFFLPLRSYEVIEGQKRSFWLKFENEPRDIIFYIYTHIIQPSIMVNVVFFYIEVIWGQWRSKEVILVKILKLTQRYDFLYTYSYDTSDHNG